MAPEASSVVGAFGPGRSSRVEEDGGECRCRRALRRPRRGAPPARRGRPAEGRVARAAAGELGCARVALGRVLRHRLLDDGVEVGSHFGPSRGRLGRGLVDVRDQRLELGAPWEGDLAGQSLVEHTAEGVDVRALACSSFGDELRRDVVGGPRELSRFAGLLLALGGLRQAEVGEVDVLVLSRARDEHVGRLHVSVDEPPLVCGIEAVCSAGHKLHRPGRIECGLVVDEPAQVGPVDVAHGDIELTFGLPGLEDRNDVGMVDRGREP